MKVSTAGLQMRYWALDVANRISMNSLLYRKPIVEKDQSGLWTLLEQLGWNLFLVWVLSIERGGRQWLDGEYWRGTEAMIPAAFRNGMKNIQVRYGRRYPHVEAIQLQKI